MANTYTAIATVTVGSGGAASMTFSSIPQTYTDLKIVASGRSTAGSLDINVKLNNQTTNFTRRVIYGDGTDDLSTAISDNAWLYSNGSTYTASTFSNCEIYIPNYTSSNYKSISSDSAIENNATTAYLILNAGLWSDTSAITSIVLAQLSGNFVEHSTATLYGIKNS
jgi:hypothetical protein